MAFIRHLCTFQKAIQRRLTHRRLFAVELLLVDVALFWVPGSCAYSERSPGAELGYLKCRSFLYSVISLFQCFE